MANARKAKTSQKELSALTDFIYEAGILARTPRSGLWFLGSGSQSVAEHLSRSSFITLALCYLTPKANKHRAVLMTLFHDFAEGRTSDLNYVHQRYGRLAEDEAMKDIAADVPFGPEVHALYSEAKEKKTLEARLVKDADCLEWIATLREEEVKGNTKAREWIVGAAKRLKTPAGKQLGKFLVRTNPDAWWFDAKDEWFVDRKPSTRKWRKKK